jgi:hypothetical protein
MKGLCKAMRIGWWSVPGTKGWVKGASTVHIEHAGKPFCKSVMTKGAIFQWCCDGVLISMVECERCKSKYDSHLTEIFEGIGGAEYRLIIQKKADAA